MRGLDLILLTHGHGDHSGQTLELMEETKVKLVASNEVCAFVSQWFDNRRLLGTWRRRTLWPLYFSLRRSPVEKKFIS